MLTAAHHRGAAGDRDARPVDAGGQGSGAGRRGRRLSAFGLLLALLAGACHRERGSEHGSSATSGASAASAAPRDPLARERLQAGKQIALTGGSFLVGSRPGEEGRDPESEPRLTKVSLGPLQMDQLPYPNDPSRQPLTGVSQREAARLCAARSARLCTELEWEMACKGRGSEPFPTGAAWSPRCERSPDACLSSLGVAGMSSLREWTASVLGPATRREPRLHVVRGSNPSAPAPEHHCARRKGLPAETVSADLGFRCCSGPPNAGLLPEPKEQPTFRKFELSAERLSELLAEAPETRPLAKDLLFFREPDAANTVVDRGDKDRKGFFFTVAPLLWSPSTGVEFLVVAARSGKDTSFVAAFHVLGDNRFQLAASFAMHDEVGPVALAYNGYIRPRLHWSTCWGCPAETGKILFRKPEAVAITQP